VVVSNQFGNTPYTVAAVFRQPEQSDIKADFLLSLQTLENPANRDGNDWADPNTTGSAFTNIYVQLAGGTNAKGLAGGITRFVRSINPGSKDDEVYLQPFSELHLAPSLNYPFQTFGSLTFFLVFAAIAVLILLIAWVNYINLSLAQSLNRSKEIGVRKVLGASRRQLMLQYMTETFLLTLASTGIAILLVDGLQSTFNEYTARPLSLQVLANGWFLFFGGLAVLLGSLLAGCYTGIVLTRVRPVTALYGTLITRGKSLSLRKALVVFQFSISIVLIIATGVIFKQLRYMKTENLGMKLDQLLVIAGPTVSSEEQAERNVSFKNSLAQLPFVKKQAASNNVPGVGFNFSTNGITSTNPQKDDERKSYAMFICDQNYFDTYGIQFAQGTAFSQNDAERSWNNVKKVILNEKAARQLGFDPSQNLIGKKFFGEILMK
jgi:putative ABC transport system permease protein